MSASGQRMSSTLVDADRRPAAPLAALGPQDHERADDERAGDRDRREQVRLDRLAEGEAQDRGRQERDDEVHGEALRARVA